MKAIKFILVAIGIVLALVLVSIIIFHIRQQPQIDGETSVVGLTDKVNIHFDQYAIPHIIATNQADAYYALGYVHAQNRLFQMDLLRRVGGGRLAEFFGEKVIEVDKLFHTLGIPEYSANSAKEFANQPKDIRIAVESYLAGINEFVKNGSTPVEYILAGLKKEEFEVKDIYQTAGYMAFSFAMGLRTDPLVENIYKQFGNEYLNDLALRHYSGQNLAPVINNQDSPIVSRLVLSSLDSLNIPLFFGSNNWAVSGSKTKSGMPLFANDTHIKYALPSVWYESHLVYPGTSLYGNFLPGIPLALIGNNQFSSWGVTMFENDDTDFYYEELNEEMTQARFLDSNWVDLEISTVEIKVKDAASIHLTITKTPHGPLINDFFESEIDKPVSIFWTYTRKKNNLPEAFFSLNHSKSIEESRNAVKLIHAPGLNVAYADIKGNIALWASAHLLNRPSHVNPKLLMNGGSGKDEIIGYYPFEKNPQQENPPSGFVYSANSQHDSLGIGVLHDGYYTTTTRMERIASLLNQNKKLDVDDMKQIVVDNFSKMDMQIAHEVSNSIEVGEDSHLKEYLNILQKWDGGHEISDIGPVAYYPLLYYLVKNTFEDELGSENFEIFLGTHLMKRSYQKLMLSKESVWFDDINTEEKESRESIFLKSAKMALNQLLEDYNSLSNLPTWGEVHTLEFSHPMSAQKPLDKLFNVGPFPMSGTNESINQQGFRLNANGLYPVQHGPQMRIVIDLSDFENSLSVNPTGQSGYFGNEHYNDQSKLFTNQQFRLQMMNVDEIKSTKNKQLILKP